MTRGSKLPLVVDTVGFLLLVVAATTTHSLIGIVHAQVTPPTDSSDCPVLIWADEFDGTALDTSKWTPQIGDGCNAAIDGSTDLCGWGNNELQSYQSSNIQVGGGILSITAREESGFDGKDYTSGRIRSLNKVEVDLTKSTYIEARIKVPDGGLGLWPAFWMMPTPEVIWPSGGEIDIMEYIGRQPFLVQSYVHYGPAWGNKEEKGSPISLPERVDADYHTFAMIKTFERITFLVDGYPYTTITSQDIEPKYTWPFEQTYHFLLNVAVGGNWPGPPDPQLTTFPTSMEVDYVRVFDMTGGKVVPRIDGTRLVHPFTTDRYCVSRLGVSTTTDGAVWSVPPGATYEVVPDNPTCIRVTFGTQSGYVTATLFTACVKSTIDGTSDTLTLQTPVEVQPFYGRNPVGIVTPTVGAVASSVISLTDSLGGATILDSDPSSSSPTLEYTRSLALNDYFGITGVSLSNLDDYVSGQSKFFMTIQTTTSAPCTLVYVQLEDSTIARPDNYPDGRHSRYECLLEDTRDYQRVACDFADQPDRDNTNLSVDKVVILVDPGVSRDDVYRFQSIESLDAGCDPSTQQCEPLQSNGPSTDNCRRRNKSEAGRCNDGLNNDLDGYDGNLQTDCDDPQCFGLDPVCLAGGDTDPPTASPTTPGQTDSPTPSPTTGAPTASPSNPPTGPGETQSPTEPPTVSPTSMPTMSPAPTTDIFDGPAECSANAACVGLVDDCCPTIDNVYLYCCFEDGTTPGSDYSREYTLITPQSPTDQATYKISTAPYFDPATAPDGTFPVISYARDAMETYDMIYYDTVSIPDAGPFLTDDKRFFIDIYSTAPSCTQILLQLDSLPLAGPANYPTGRHSRYITFTTKTNEWERLEFHLLDQPDDTVPNDAINAIVLFFDPGTNTDDVYYFRNLDVSIKGCTSNCENPSPKSCPALFNGEVCDDGMDNDGDGWVDCEDSECVDDPYCGEQLTRSFRSASNFLQTEDAAAAQNSGSSSSWTQSGTVLRTVTALVTVSVVGLFV